MRRGVGPGRGPRRRYPLGDEPPTRREPRPTPPAAPLPSAPTRRASAPLAATQLVGDVGVDQPDFRPYPGFHAFPYQEYSEVFWGTDYKVLRGGSWAADPVAVRNTFRNWDPPSAARSSWAEAARPTSPVPTCTLGEA